MSEPRYIEIKKALLREIQMGTLQPGNRIDSEHKLARHYDVSRLTVQRAVRELVSEGLLRRTQGSGTFVTDSTHRFSLIEVRDVVEEIKLMGGEPTTEVLIQRRFTPGEEILELLELPSGSPVFHAAVVQSMDGIPLAHEERFVICDVYSDFLDQDFTQCTMFSYLAQRSALEEIENLVSAVHVDQRLADLLDINAAEPCLRIQRRNWYQKKCVSYTRIAYAGTRQVLGSRYHPYQSERESIKTFARNGTD